MIQENEVPWWPKLWSIDNVTINREIEVQKFRHTPSKVHHEFTQKQPGSLKWKWVSKILEMIMILLQKKRRGVIIIWKSSFWMEWKGSPIKSYKYVLTHVYINLPPLLLHCKYKYLRCWLRDLPYCGHHPQLATQLRCSLYSCKHSWYPTAPEPALFNSLSSSCNFEVVLHCVSNDMMKFSKYDRNCMSLEETNPLVKWIARLRFPLSASISIS